MAASLTTTNLQQLYTDITKASEVAEVPWSEKVIWENLNAHEQFFTSSAVAFRTTSKPVEKRDLSVRYVDTERLHDPFDTVLSKGLYTRQGHPIEDMLPEVMAQFPLLGLGVDFSVKHGFEKIWPFFRPAVSVEQIFSLKSLPSAIKNYTGHFKRFGMEYISLFALDYWNKTFNLYFMVRDRSQVAPGRVAAMIQDAGFEVPSQQELEIDSNTVGIYQTFSWESPKMERLCFILAGRQEDVPGYLDPVLDQFARNAPIKASERLFTYNTTYSHRGNYLKIEADYNASMGIALGKAIASLPQ